MKDFELPEFTDKEMQELFQLFSARHDCLLDNHILERCDRKQYSVYSKQNRGCSMENPFIINDEEFCIKLEYFIIAFLMHSHRSNDVANHQLKKQRLCTVEDKHLDCLVMTVTFRDGTTAEEEYWFDITPYFKKLMSNSKSSSH